MNWTETDETRERNTFMIIIVSIVCMLVLMIFLTIGVTQNADLRRENKVLTEQVTQYEQKALDWQVEAENTQIKLAEAEGNLQSCSEKMEELETQLTQVLDRVVALEKENKELIELLKQYEEQPVNEYSAIKMSKEERELLEWMLALEAKDQPDDGQRAVVEVAFNRVLSPEWQDTVYNVIMAKGQFDSMNYLNKPYATPSQKERDNIDYVLEHGRTVLPADYVFFATYKANGKDFIKIADHYFSRAK